MPNPTDEQLAILDAEKSTKSNLILNALAGCGKTSTLLMVERASKTKPILYLVFNKRNADEAEYNPKRSDEADKRMSSTTTVRTFNSMGHRIWAKTLSGKKISLDPKKSRTLLRQLIDDAPKSVQSEMWDSFWEVISGVEMAKALGYIPKGKFTQAKHLCTKEALHARLEEKPDELTQDLIDEVLFQSIRTAYEGFIDYNDQIYMPALFGGTYPQFPLVMADEAQDLNPVNHEMLKKLVKHRIIAVGDPWQSIYGFRGAVQSGMQALQTHFQMSPLSLSVSFRCPQAIVEYAQVLRVPHFKFVKPGGHVETLKTLDPASIPDDSAIICRNNAPLFRCALNLLISGRGVAVRGSDIGPKLVAIMKKFGNDDLKREYVLAAIDEWLVEKLKKESTTATDLAECMRVFARHGDTLSQALGYAEHLFAQRGKITLLTGHKAKGLEWDVVYHLDPWMIKDDEQDRNLHYVITTRAKDRLYEIDSRSIEWTDPS